MKSKPLLVAVLSLSLLLFANLLLVHAAECELKSQGCYDTSGNIADQQSLTPQNFGYYLPEDAYVPGACTVPSGRPSVDSAKQPNPDSNSGACQCISNTAYYAGAGSGFRCCGDDSDDCARFTGGALCAMGRAESQATETLGPTTSTGNFGVEGENSGTEAPSNPPLGSTQTRWVLGNQLTRFKIYYVGCPNKNREMIYDGQNWRTCDGFFKAGYGPNNAKHDYLCTMKATDGSFKGSLVECCASGGCHSEGTDGRRFGLGDSEYADSDVCPNIAGEQTTLPIGKRIDENRNCVDQTPIQAPAPTQSPQTTNPPGAAPLAGTEIARLTPLRPPASSSSFTYNPPSTTFTAPYSGQYAMTAVLDVPNDLRYHSGTYSILAGDSPLLSLSIGASNYPPEKNVELKMGSVTLQQGQTYTLSQRFSSPNNQAKVDFYNSVQIITYQDNRNNVCYKEGAFYKLGDLQYGQCRCRTCGGGYQEYYRCQSDGSMKYEGFRDGDCGCSNINCEGSGGQE